MKNLSLRQIRYTLAGILLLMFFLTELYFLKHVQVSSTSADVLFAFYFTYLVKIAVSVIMLLVFSDYVAHRLKRVEY